MADAGVAISEALARVDGIIAGCGQAGLVVLNHLYNGTPLSAQELVNTIKLSQTKGAGAGGVSTPKELQATAKAQGLNLSIMSPSANLGAQLDALLGAGKPVEVLVGHAGWGFGGSDIGVQGHYIDILGGSSATGYQVADPNTPQSKVGQLVTYTLDQIRKAVPEALLAPTSPLPPTSVLPPGVQGATQIGASSVDAIAQALSALTNPDKLKAAFQYVVERSALTALVFAVIIIGLILVFWEPASQAAQATAQKAASAAKIAAVAA